jgi:hypothetical protein
MSVYINWLKRGLRTHLARRISLDDLELIVENGRAFNIMHDSLATRGIAEPNNTWAKTPLTKSIFQTLPWHYKSVSFPCRYCVSTFPTGTDPAGTHCLLKIFMSHPYVRRAGTDYTRFMVFGQRPENMLILAVHTDDSRSSTSWVEGRAPSGTAGRTHKSYVLGKQWIHYGLSIPGPTMGYKIR